MDLKQLEYFVHVAELGSFTRASRLLSVAQPALSRQVRTLEVELRQPLFQRNGRGVTLTEPGKRLLAHGRGILSQVERARTDLEDHRGAAVGRLVVALPPSVSRMLTGPLVRAFRGRFPKATLSVVEGLSSYVLEWLAVGRIDCGVVYHVAPSAEVELRPVLDEPLYLVSAARPAPRAPTAAQGGATRRRKRPAAAPAGSVTLAQVAEHPLVIPSRPHSIRMLLEAALANSGRRAQVALEVESVPAMLELVEHDGLHAVLARNAIVSSGRPEAFRVQPIDGLTTALWIATSAQRHRGPLIEQSSDLLHELLLRIWHE